MPAANPVLLLTSGVKSDSVVEAKEAPALSVNCASALKGRRATAAASSTGAAMRDMGATSCVGLPNDYDTHAAWTSKPDWRCGGIRGGYIQPGAKQDGRGLVTRRRRCDRVALNRVVLSRRLTPSRSKRRLRGTSYELAAGQIRRPPPPMHRGDELARSGPPARYCADCLSEGDVQ